MSELVIHDATGTEIGWYDPVETVTRDGQILRFTNGFHDYEVEVPVGGAYTIRPIESGASNE